VKLHEKHANLAMNRVVYSETSFPTFTYARKWLVESGAGEDGNDERCALLGG
jgi:hypothetical protein